MKAVIDGKKYDTEIAEQIAEDGYSYSGDFRYWYEVLYRTKKGNFFVAGEGGALTKYAVPVGNNSTSGSERITPLTRQEAFEWCERHGATEAIETHFSDLIEDA